MSFITIVVACLICGSVFALLATGLSITKGNRIADIMRAIQVKNPDAMRDDNALRLVLGKVTLTTTVPIVALYVVAFLVAFALPAFLWWLGGPPVFVSLIGHFDPPPSAESPVCVAPTAMQPSTGTFIIKLPYINHEPEMLMFESHSYSPKTMVLTFDTFSGTMSVQVPNDVNYREPQIMRIDNYVVNLNHPVALVLAPPQTKEVSSKPSKPPPLPNSDLANVTSSPPNLQ